MMLLLQKVNTRLVHDLAPGVGALCARHRTTLFGSRLPRRSVATKMIETYRCSTAYRKRVSKMSGADACTATRNGLAFPQLSIGTSMNLEKRNGANFKSHSRAVLMILSQAKRLATVLNSLEACR